MILVTTGTNEQPFDRLVRAAAGLDVAEPLLVQHGASRVPHGAGEWVDFLPFEELAACAGRARVIVCHAGVGSIMLARRCGHRPIVVPRRHQLGEAVDDHQLALAQRLSSSGVVTLVEDVDELADAILAGRACSDESDVGGGLRGAGGLAAEVRSLLADLGCAPLGGRAA
ncbi:MAG: glycosyltransferase [Thermoleophilia bacterium]